MEKARGNHGSPETSGVTANNGMQRRRYAPPLHARRSPSLSAKRIVGGIAVQINVTKADQMRAMSREKKL